MRTLDRRIRPIAQLHHNNISLLKEMLDAESFELCPQRMPACCVRRSFHLRNIRVCRVITVIRLIEIIRFIRVIRVVVKVSMGIRVIKVIRITKNTRVMWALLLAVRHSKSPNRRVSSQSDY
jgi:hypothetical protein